MYFKRGRNSNRNCQLCYGKKMHWRERNNRCNYFFGYWNYFSIPAREIKVKCRLDTVFIIGNLFWSASVFILLWWNTHNIEFTMLAIFKCTVQCGMYSSHCCVAVNTMHLENSSSCKTEPFYLLNNSASHPVSHTTLFLGFWLGNSRKWSLKSICHLVTGLFQLAYCP